MFFLLTFDWSWLLLSVLVGFVMGWIAVVQRGRVVSKRMARWLALVAVALVVIAVGRLIPGRPGYWLELALLMVAMYIVGCALGSWLREWVLSHTAPAS